MVNFKHHSEIKTKIFLKIIPWLSLIVITQHCKPVVPRMNEFTSLSTWLLVNVMCSL